MATLNNNDVILLLKEKNIFITQPRIKVLKTIYNHCQPVFIADTILKFDKGMNRISVYRALQLFVENKILVTVPNTNGRIEYGLWLNSQKQNEVITLRKFQCKKCGNVTFEETI